MTDLTKVRWLRQVGIAEGISFLVLLLVAMPLKYFLGWPLAVKVVGWAHGILFMAYLAAVVLAAGAMKYNAQQLLVAFAASLVPAGTFWLDRGWRAREQALLAIKVGGRANIL